MIKNGIIGLTALIMCSTLYGANLDSLYAAIEESKLEQVKGLIKGIALSRGEKEALLDFAQNVIFQRKSDCETFKIRPRYEAKALWPFALWIPLVYMSTLGYNNREQRQEQMKVFFMGLVGTLILGCYTVRESTRCYLKDLSEQYSNSMKIKNIIYQIPETQ